MQFLKASFSVCPVYVIHPMQHSHPYSTVKWVLCNGPTKLVVLQILEVGCGGHLLSLHSQVQLSAHVCCNCLCGGVRVCVLSAYLPTLVFVYAGQCHPFCRILLAFAGQYCTAFLVENTDTLRLILSQIFTKTQILQGFPLPPWLSLAYSLGNGSELLTHWHPSCGWH